MDAIPAINTEAEFGCGPCSNDLVLFNAKKMDATLPSEQSLNSTATATHILTSSGSGVKMPLCARKVLTILKLVAILMTTQMTLDLH